MAGWGRRGAHRWRPLACPRRRTRTQCWGSCAHLQLPGLASPSPLAVDAFVTLPDEEHPGVPGVEVARPVGGRLLEHSRPSGRFASPAGCPPRRWNFAGRRGTGRASGPCPGPLRRPPSWHSPAPPPVLPSLLPCRGRRPGQETAWALCEKTTSWRFVGCRKVGAEPGSRREPWPRWAPSPLSLGHGPRGSDHRLTSAGEGAVRPRGPVWPISALGAAAACRWRRLEARRLKAPARGATPPGSLRPS